METCGVDNRFNFFLPVDISKGKNENGEDVVQFSGLASNGHRDLDGETMADCDFSIEDRFFVNYNHEKSPDSIIGQVVDFEKRKGHLFVKGELYTQIPKAKAVVNLMKALERGSKKTNLGISVEGKVIERDSNDKSKIKKALISAIALCPMPKNCQTYAQLIQKGFTGDDIYQDPATFEYEEVDDNLAKFVSANGSEMIVKSNGSIDFKTEKTEREWHLITLVKADQAGQLDENQKEMLKNFYKKFFC